MKRLAVLALLLPLAACAPRTPRSPTHGPPPSRVEEPKRTTPLAGWEQRPVRTIVLDAGHGGRDPGTMGGDALIEKEVTLDLARRMRDRLVRWGFRVVMTRDADETIELAERAARADAARGDVFVSLHVNAAPRPERGGIETYLLDASDERHSDAVAARENGVAPEHADELQRTVAQMRVSEVSQRSALLARHVQGAVVRGLRARYGHAEDRGVKKGPFYVLFLSSMPAILVEVGFATNPEDALRLSHPEHLELLADRIASGLMAYAIESGPVVAREKP